MASRCPYSEPFSASVLHGSSFLIAFACLFFHSVFPQSASLVLCVSSFRPYVLGLGTKIPLSVVVSRFRHRSETRTPVNHLEK